MLTAAVLGLTLVVSLAASARPALMQLLVRNLPRLQEGEWWRVVTPILVQPSGWGQLIFNALGIAVVGAVLQRHVGWAAWSTTYLTGGIGSIAVYSAWHPDDTGGGSSAAVAALIGAFLVMVNAHGRSDRLEGVALVYSVFFAAYLTALDLGGVAASVIAGNVAIVATVVARARVSGPVLARASLAVAIVASIAMTLARDDHGIGLAIGIALAGLVLGRRRMLSRGVARGWRIASAVLGVVAAAELTWLGWVQLLGVPLVTHAGASQRRVGWFSVGLVATAASCAAALALQLLVRRFPDRGSHLWTGLCVGIALVSLAGPLTLAVGTTATVALVSLHLVCLVAILGLLRPTAQVSGGGPA